LNGKYSFLLKKVGSGIGVAGREMKILIQVMTDSEFLDFVKKVSIPGKTKFLLLYRKGVKLLGTKVKTVAGDIEIPGNYKINIADNGKGVRFQKPGSSGKDVNSIRVMEPTPDYPNGYVRKYNSSGQAIDIRTGKQAQIKGEADTHFELAEPIFK
jgi:hypothetical protein